MPQVLYLCEPNTNNVGITDSPLPFLPMEAEGKFRLMLEVTSNYFQIFFKVFPKRGPNIGDPEVIANLTEINSIRYIYGMSGAQSIALLNEMMNTIAQRVGTEVTEDKRYAKGGNAIEVLQMMVRMAEAYPEGRWAGN